MCKNTNTTRQWLKDIRTKKKIFQKDIAAVANITAQQYSAIETGARNPSTDVAKKIGEFLGFSWTLFFEEIKK